MILGEFSERGLSRFLRNYSFWSRLYGIKGKTPCHVTFSNFKKRNGEKQLKKAMKNLAEKLVEMGAV